MASPEARPEIRPMKAADVFPCAQMVVASEIGLRYGFGDEGMAASLNAALATGGELFIAESGGIPLGFAWIDRHGAFSSAPYLRLIAVSAECRGRGVGSLLLAEFERRCESVGRDFCLLVSDFNAAAIELYTRHGYEKRGALPDFARPGITEILMVKRRRPSGPTDSTSPSHSG